MSSIDEAGSGAATLRKESSRRAWVLGSAGVAAAAGVGLLAAPRRGGTGSKGPVTDERFPDVPLLTHEGTKVRFAELVKGRIVFINMMYAQCSNRCPPVTQNLKRVHELLGARAGKDVFMYSISLQPAFDTPQDLRAYMKINDVRGPGWTFLTGAGADVERLRRALGFANRDPELDADITQHTGMVCIGCEPLDRWCMMPALLRPEKIADTLMAIDPVARAAGRPQA